MDLNGGILTCIKYPSTSTCTYARNLNIIRFYVLVFCSAKGRSYHASKFTFFFFLPATSENTALKAMSVSSRPLVLRVPAAATELGGDSALVPVCSGREAGFAPRRTTGSRFVSYERNQENDEDAAESSCWCLYEKDSMTSRVVRVGATTAVSPTAAQAGAVQQVLFAEELRGGVLQVPMFSYLARFSKSENKDNIGCKSSFTSLYRFSTSSPGARWVVFASTLMSARFWTKSSVYYRRRL